ncbi:MAG: 23S rRNA (adenine(2503)-C(2))-methyltransferase RlmN [Oscillospiraceae bacterium]|nr:23S rRNA (adenine(2503)-C(2))-methyltransferase RlmN [Oscillospiraceae bacterium]
MSADRLNLRGLARTELAGLLNEMEQPAYRAKQIFSWLHQKRVSTFDEMTNLPASFRQSLAQRCTIGGVKVQKRLVSSIDGTVKYLYGLDGGDLVEGVLMGHRHGNSLCISSQAGCRMGCAFCASALGGLSRNLTTGEILGQVYAAADDIAPERIGSIVMMGVGEPLDNFENVCRFLELVSHPDGFGLSLRRISLSTCGLVDEIYRLAEKKYPVTLSVSLHAANDDLRSELMPINRKYGIAALLKACRDYFEATGRRVSFEYSLMAGKNDAVTDAKALAALLKGRGDHVNLIPHNPVKERALTRSNRETVLAFQKELEIRGINATIRRELGADLDAACGQLRRTDG